MISGEEASDHRLSTVSRAGTLKPSSSQLPTSTESRSSYALNWLPLNLCHLATVAKRCLTFL